MNILVGGDLRIASITEKTPLKNVAASITKDAIINKVTLLQQTIKRDYMITSPRIAVLALNPRSNEDESCGSEEREIIIPAIDELASKGIQLSVLTQPMTFFGKGYYMTSTASCDVSRPSH